jgi:hypothetical protein
VISSERPQGYSKIKKDGGLKIEAEQLCQKMMDDLKIKKSLPEDRQEISGETEIADERSKPYC